VPVDDVDRILARGHAEKYSWPHRSRVRAKRFMHCSPRSAFHVHPEICREHGDAVVRRLSLNGSSDG
jgi:hypothetical protein